MAVHRLVGLVAVAGALGAVPAAAQGALTPDGPATVRGNYFGPHTYEPPLNGVLVGWSVTVGPGGNAGPVRLRVLRPGDRGTVVGSGPLEWLPATPGTHRFGLNPGIPYDYRDEGLALDQQVGAHAIVERHAPQPERGRLADPAQLHALDVFRPPLAESASGVEYSERRLGEQLLVRPTIERDLDRDRLGDETQDSGDLRLRDAWVAERKGRKMLIGARVRNVGNTVRHLPHIVAPPAWRSLRCEPPRLSLNLACPGPVLAPGAEADLALRVTLWEGAELARVAVASEGVDTNPADNVGPLAPRLRLRALGRRRLSFSLASTQPGKAKIVARVAGVRMVRKVRFGSAGRRSVRLAPRTRRDRRRLTSARRRPGRLRAVVTATMSSARTSLRLGL